MPTLLPAYSIHRPAGDLSSGVPPSTLSGGAWQFRSSVYVLAEPTLNPSIFADRVRESLAVVAPSITLASAVVNASREGLGWWITVTGAISVRGSATLDGLNLAIGRALTSDAVRWGEPASGRHEVSQRAFTDAFRRADACSGGRNTTSVVERACTRVLAANASPPMPTAPSAGVLCTIRTQQVVYLRRSQTFATAGAAAYPTGTTVEILSLPLATQGRLTLYQVRIGTATGWAAFVPEETVGCGAGFGGGVVTSAPGPTSSYVTTAFGPIPYESDTPPATTTRPSTGTPATVPPTLPTTLAPPAPTVQSPVSLPPPSSTVPANTTTAAPSNTGASTSPVRSDAERWGMGLAYVALAGGVLGGLAWLGWKMIERVEDRERDEA